MFLWHTAAETQIKLSNELKHDSSGKKSRSGEKKIVTLVFQNIWMTWEKYTKSKKHKELCALLLLRMENRCFKEGDPFGDYRGPDKVNKVVGVLRRSCRCNGPFCWSLEVLVCIYEIPGDSSGPEEFFASLSMTLWSPHDPKVVKEKLF